MIAIVGDVEPDEVAAMLAQRFASLTRHEDLPLGDVVWPGTVPPAAESREKQQTALAMLFPGPARHDPRRFAARVLSAIASGLGGRFFEQLRDKQSLAYTVSAFPVERRSGGLFAAYIATDPAREEEARAGLLAEFAKLREAPPSPEELERAKRFLIGTNAISQQSASSVLGDVIDAWLFGEGLQELGQVDASVQSVTGDDVLALARDYFTEQCVVEGVVRGTATERRSVPRSASHSAAAPA